MTKNLTSDEKAKRNRNIKAAVIFASIAIAITVVVVYAQEYFATESLVDYKTTQINGDTLSIILTEKTRSRNRRMGDPVSHPDEMNDTHYGYFLELYDSAQRKSLDKIEFDSPVHLIPETPRLRVFSDGTIWMISTNIMQDRDEPGFILKFKIENQKIIQQEFKLDEKYYITGLDENAVILGDNDNFGGTTINPVFGGTYLDLATGKIVELEPYSLKSEDAGW
jgi:hypothetical protein